MLGDSVERISEIESESVGLSIFSPPFISLYTYSPTERDVGNCQNEEEFFNLQCWALTAESFFDKKEWI